MFSDFLTIWGAEKNRIRGKQSGYFFIVCGGISVLFVGFLQFLSGFDWFWVKNTEFHWFWVKNNTARAARKKIGCIFHVHKNCMPQCFQNIEYYISEKNRILKTACPSVFRIFNIQISGVWKSESSTLVGYWNYICHKLQ